MNQSPFLLIVTEGFLDSVVAEKLLDSLKVSRKGLSSINKGGGEQFWKNIYKYNNAAKKGPIFALADLEQKACVSLLFNEYLRTRKHPQLILRIAVKMVESWLLADTKGVASFFSIDEKKIPIHPEEERHPKLTLVNLVRQYSTNRSLKEDLVPRGKSTALVGRGYSFQMERFVRNQWNPIVAQERSKSLCKAIQAIRKVTKKGVLYA